jgi:hypothetical protein
MFDILGIRKQLCAYKDVFGEPRKGAHSYRLLNIAIVDLGLTILFIIWFTSYTKISWWKVTGVVFVLMIFFHWLFCVKTTLNKLLLGDFA